MRSIVIAVIALLGQLAVTAQDEIAIGQWRTHFPVNRMIGVTQSATKAFYATDQMVLIYDKSEGSVQRLDKISGLTQVGIKCIKYHRELDLLLIAYADGNLDVVTQAGQIVNIADIQRYSLIAEKDIHHIRFEGELAYLACSFGLVELDLVRYEVRNTYFTDNFDVRASALRGDTLFMATDDGIYQGNPGINLSDFSNWLPHGRAQGLAAVHYATVMEPLGNRLFASVNDTLKYYDGQQWHEFESLNGANNQLLPFFTTGNGFRNLEQSLDGSQLVLTTGLEMMAIDPNGYYFPIGGGSFIQTPRQAVKDGGVFYLADFVKGAVVLDNFVPNTITANAPFSKNMSHLAAGKGEVWVTSGGVTDSWQSLIRNDGAFVYREGRWEVYNEGNRTELAGVFDMIPVALHPSQERVYLGSYNRGLVEVTPDSVHVWGEAGTALRTPALDPSTVRVTGLAFDDDENLWISNYESPTPVVVYRNDGTWESYPLTSGTGAISQMVIDRNQYKWMVISRGGGGIAVLNETVTSGAPYRFLTTANSELPTNDVNCLAVDQDGDVWVGTIQGTVVFECGGNLFRPEGCTGRRVIVSEDDFGEYLLATENVRAIAVDGADRKWFGTDNGIFVQSPSGEETLLRFTVNNSPLPSNKIIDIAINPDDGEVFIATEEGLVSYRSDATQGGNTHAEEVRVFPNPVRPDYDGPIAIRGLVSDADVKITDISGQLIYQTRANGGQAIWNGRDYNGRPAATGVYLVFSSGSGGFETLVTKVTVIR